MPPENQQPASPYPTVPNVVPGQPVPPPPKKQRPWALIIALVIFVVLFLGTAGFASQIASERDDYKNNVDQKIAVAVEDAKLQTIKEKEVEFLEREKNPYRSYSGPAAFGELSIQYPKTWSASIAETGKGKTPINGYLHPNFVPDLRSGAGFALHIEVVEQPYDKVLGSYESNAKKGLVRISPYAAPKVPNVGGSRIDGEVAKDHQGSTVLFPLRDKTIRLTTLSPQFVPDFNNIILPNLVFTP
jgi:hypothetical protein